MKSRIIKRIGTLFMAIVMLLCLNSTWVLAETVVNLDGSGRDLNHKVSLTLTKYEEDTTAVNVSDQRPLAGIPFTLQRVELKSGSKQGSTNISDYNLVGTAIQKSTNINGVVTWVDTDGLVQGIYLVTELPSSTVSAPSVSFLVSLPMYVNGEWVYDVTAYPKNTVDPGPDIEKEETTPVGSGNIVSWEYKVDIPADIANAKKYELTDKLDSRLTYVSDSIIGWYIDQNGVSHNLTANDHYSVAYSDATDTLVITITAAGFAELANAYITGFTGIPKLHFSFNTSLSTTDENNTGVVENGGSTEYTNENGNTYTPKIPDEEKPSTDLFGIHIYKINVNAMPLKGAEFKLYKDEQCRTQDMVTTDTYVTDDNGDAYIYGLVEGTYYLMETKAPTGYNAITTPIKVVVNKGVANAEYIVKISITNSNAFTLPQTGGMGTVLFTIGGVALIAVACTLLFVAKKKKTSR